MDKMEATTKLSELLIAIQSKSGIPPPRQQLMTDSGNIDKQDTNKTLLQLHIAKDCHILVIDDDPGGDLEILPSPTYNQSGDASNNLLRSTHFIIISSQQLNCKFDFFFVIKTAIC